MKRSALVLTIAMIAAVSVWTATLTAAEPTEGGAGKTKPQAASSPATRPAARPVDPPSKALTIAILDFDAKTPGAPELGGQIGEALTAMLSGEPGLTLVDRGTLARTLQEHELNLSGAVDTEKAVKIGKIVGARILVTGKAFTLGKQLFITAKLIGTETSLVEGVLVKGTNGDDVGLLVVKLSEKLAQQLRESGPKLVAEDDAAKDPVPALKEKLKGMKLPKVAVIVTERHYSQPQAVRVIDPAVETEIKHLLRECGFDVMDVEQNELADWAKCMNKNDVNAWPRGLREVDVVITGEAFSEFAARIGNLVSCSARAEVNLISRSDGKIVLADRDTTRAVDLSEQIAGKKALQKAGRVLGIRILEHFVKPAESRGK